MSRQSSTKKDRVLCIDCDSAVYAVAFSAVKKMHYGIINGQIKFSHKLKTDYNKWFKQLSKEEQESVVYDVTEENMGLKFCITNVNKWIRDLMTLAGSTRSVVLLTKGGSCFRTYRATLKKYKGNREGTERPQWYQEIREHLVKHHKALIYAKWEADDTACMFMQSAKEKEDQLAILAAIDKDLEQQSCMHVNPNKKKEGVYYVDEVEGAYSFYKQMLMGDVADNIPGLKGVGEKAKCVTALADCETIEDMCLYVYQTYVSHYSKETGKDEVTYTPWWWLEKYDDEEYMSEYKDAALVLELRKSRKKKVIKCKAIDIFRENADLLYMLRTPDDQYTPQHPTVAKLIKPYPKGIVAHCLGE